MRNKQLENSSWSPGFAKQKFPQSLSFKPLLKKASCLESCISIVKVIALHGLMMIMQALWAIGTNDWVGCSL